MSRYRKHLVHVPRFDEEPDFVVTFTEYDDRLVDTLIENRTLVEREEVGGYYDRRRAGKVT